MQSIEKAVREIGLDVGIRRQTLKQLSQKEECINSGQNDGDFNWRNWFGERE